MGTAGTGGMGGTSAVGTGGTSGAAGASGGNGGGPTSDAAVATETAAPDSATGPTDASAPPDGPVAPPPDGGPSACNVTPGPAAATAKLAFRAISLTGLPTNVGPGKSPDGFTELKFIPGAPSEFLLTQKGGNLTRFRLNGNQAQLVAAYRISGVFAEDDCGLVSVTFDPNFASNNVIYAGYCTATNRSKVSRFVLGPTALTGAVDVINFSEPQGTKPWHSIGSLGFDPQGNMWMLHGEFTDSSNAQNQNSTMGKLLRFIPRAAGGYDPAPGNAYPNDPSKSPIVYALGFRSPWRAYLDGKGRFLVGDVGNTENEEVNLVTAAGQNFGWNGSRSGPCSGDGCAGTISPLVTYRNGGNDPYLGSDDGNEGFESRAGRAVWIGGQYRDCGNDRYGGALTGVYLFGDWYTGWVRGAVIDDSGRKTADRMLANVPGLTSWDQAADGYLYATKFGRYGTGGLAMEGQGVFRVERAP